MVSGADDITTCQEFIMVYHSAHVQTLTRYLIVQSVEYPNCAHPTAQTSHCTACNASRHSHKMNPEIFSLASLQTTACFVQSSHPGLFGKYVCACMDHFRQQARNCHSAIHLQEYRHCQKTYCLIFVAAVAYLYFLPLSEWC